MVWNQVKAAMGAQNELLKGAFNETREALKTAYTFETDTVEVVEVAVKPKTKAKTKKTAEAA